MPRQWLCAHYCFAQNPVRKMWFQRCPLIAVRHENMPIQLSSFIRALPCRRVPSSLLQKKMSAAQPAWALVRPRCAAVYRKVFNRHAFRHVTARHPNVTRKNASTCDLRPVQSMCAPTFEALLLACNRQHEEMPTTTVWPIGGLVGESARRGNDRRHVGRRLARGDWRLLPARSEASAARTVCVSTPRHHIPLLAKSGVRATYGRDSTPTTGLRPGCIRAQCVAPWGRAWQTPKSEESVVCEHPPGEKGMRSQSK